MTKRKFSKLLGKKAEYTGVKTEPEVEHEGGRTLFLDIKHKGKLYSDHIWVKTTEKINRFEFDTEVGFKAIGYMYTDNHGVRKQGLTRCHEFRTMSDTEGRRSSKNNYNQMAKRKTKRKY